MTTGKPYLSPHNLIMCSIKPGKVPSMFSVCKVSYNMLVCKDVKSLKCRLNCSCGLCHTVNKRGFSVCENGSILCFGIVSTLTNLVIMEITIKVFLCCARSPMFFSLTLKCL